MGRSAQGSDSKGPGRSARQRNEGEGNRTAAKQYNKETKEFVDSGRVDEAAQEAQRAMEGKERDELLRDEATGRSRARS